MGGRAGARAKARGLSWFPNHPRKRWWVDFDGDSSFIDCGDDASLEDLHAGFTVDGWIMVPDEQLAHYHCIASKYDVIDQTAYGWYFVVDHDTGALAAAAIYQTTAAESTGQEALTAGVWTHVLACFNPVDSKLYFAIGGAWCSYTIQTGAVGVIASDADIDFLMGAMLTASEPTDFFRGGIQWLRVSSGLRWPIGFNFTPPVMCAPPTVDGTTLELWALDEGVGVSTEASVVSPTNDGAMTDCAWYRCVE